MKLIRAFLILAILAGIGAAVVSFTVGKDNVQKVIDDRDKEKKDKETAQSDLAKTRTALGTATNALNATRADLAKANAEIKSLNIRATTAEEAAKGLTDQLAKAKGERDAAQQELSRWTLLNVTIEGVKQMQVDIKRITEQRDGYIQENKSLAKNAAQLQAELDHLIGKSRPVLMPGLKGKIVAVDPKFDFVVLDVGGEQGAKERGELLVNRNGELIAKIRITSVEPNRSIANIIPGWKSADKEVMEGDQVFY